MASADRPREDAEAPAGPYSSEFSNTTPADEYKEDGDAQPGEGLKHAKSGDLLTSYDGGPLKRGRQR